MFWLKKPGIGFWSAGLVLCTGLLLISGFRLFSFSYFYRDDFNNLAFAQYKTATGLLTDLTHPHSDTYRPVGTAVYWWMLHVFGLDPLPYRIVSWLIHCTNLLLAFVLIRRAAASSFGAAVGIIFFAFHQAWQDVLYDFGTIFELVTGFWFLLALWIYARYGNSRTGIVAVSVVYLLANNTKEMAITMPAVWILYDLLIRRREARLSLLSSLWGSVTRLWPATLIALWFLAVKLPQLGGRPSSDPYYMDLSLRGAFQGYIWYFNSLYRSEVGWTFWIVLICLGIGISLWLRSSWSLFFIGYIVLTLLPVVFLTNHRASFYWYIPALGLSGLIGMTAGAISAWIRSRIPCFAAGLAGLVIFAGLCLAHYEHQKSLSFFDRSWLAELSTEYQSFVEELRLLPEPGPGEILYYQSVPRYFDEVVATAAVRVALRRPDLYARIVSSFPSESLCRLRFDNNRLIRESVP